MIVKSRLVTVGWSILGIIVGLMTGVYISSPGGRLFISELFVGEESPTQISDLGNLISAPQVYVDPWVDTSLPFSDGIVTITPQVSMKPTTTSTVLPTTTLSSIPTTVISKTPAPTTTPITTSTPTVTQSSILNSKHFTKKVTLIRVNPQVSCPYKNNATMSLVSCVGWNDPDTLADGVVNSFKQATGNHVNFQIVERFTHNSFTKWKQGCFTDEYWATCSNAGTCSRPTRCTNNFVYTPAEWFACTENNDKCLQGETDMKSLLKEYGIPDKVNNNQIDEVWLYAAPWMSMWESQAVGPRAISINSPPLVDYAYDRTIAVMPMSYERDLGTSLHNFGHRIEATMGRTYNSWEQNRTSHNWDKFGLVKAQSPDYFYSGCGSTHYPPNAFNDYEYGNSASVASSCDSFLTYPNLSTYGQITNQIGCSTWGCTEQGYLTWWFSKIPKFKGVGSDSRANDWWYYILELDNVFRTGEVVTENQ